jgi:hypothetical protein
MEGTQHVLQASGVPVTMSIMPWNSLHVGSKDVRSSKNRTPVTNIPVLRVASGSDVHGGRGASAHSCLSYKTRPQSKPQISTLSSGNNTQSTDTVHHALQEQF